MKYIFIDTNIFLHFQFFDNIDWGELLSTKDFKLILAPIVIDELDRHKVDNSKKGKKARKVLQRLEEMFESNDPNKSDNTIDILLKKPPKDIFRKYDLVLDEPDQKLLASILDFIESNKTQKVILCTDDVGARLRAKNKGIDVMTLPSNLRLKPENSIKDKAIQELKKELVTLKSKAPKLSLLFDNGKTFKKFSKNSSETLNLEIIEAEVESLKEKYPYMDYTEIDNGPKDNFNIIAALNPMIRVTREQVDDYNKRLDLFFEKYKGYLTSKYRYENEKKLTELIDLLLVNNGNIPAEDIDIHLHFPDGFKLMEYEDFKKPPKEPNPPSKPKSKFESIQSISHFPTGLYSSSNFTPEKLNKPSIKKTNSYDVDYSRKYLKHNYTSSLEKLIVLYDSFEDMKNFEIDFIITSANMTSPRTGSLKVIFGNQN